MQSVLQLYGWLRASNLRRNVASATATTLLKGALLVVAYPIYIRHLGYQQYGLWLAVSAIASFAQLGNLGTGQALTKFVAEEFARNDTLLVQSYLTTALLSLSLSGLAAFLLVLRFRTALLFILRIEPASAGLAHTILPYIALLSVCAFVVDLLLSTLIGVGRMDITNGIQLAGRVAAISVSILFLAGGFGVKSLLAGDAVSCVLTCGLAVTMLRRAAGVRVVLTDGYSFQRLAAMLRFGSGLVTTTVIGMFLIPLNKAVLSRYAGSASVSVYEIAYGSALQLRSILESGFRALIPEAGRLSAFQSEESARRVRHVKRRATQLIFTVGVPAYLAAMLLADPLLRLWLGPSIHPMLPATFRILAVGSLLSLFGSVPMYLLIGLGRIRQVVCSYILQSGTNLLGICIAVLIFTPSLTAVALATAAGLGASTAYLFGASRSHRGPLSRRAWVPANRVEAMRESGHARLDEKLSQWSPKA